MLRFCAALAAAFLCAPAWAGPDCRMRAEIKAAVTQTYGETVAGVGELRPPGKALASVWEIYVSPEGTLSIVQSWADGLSCVITIGAFVQRFLPPPAAKKGREG